MKVLCVVVVGRFVATHMLIGDSALVDNWVRGSVLRCGNFWPIAHPRYRMEVLLCFPHIDFQSTSYVVHTCDGVACSVLLWAGGCVAGSECERRAQGKPLLRAGNVCGVAQCVGGAVHGSHAHCIAVCYLRRIHSHGASQGKEGEGSFPILPSCLLTAPKRVLALHPSQW